jgi:hypothetical protein
VIYQTGGDMIYHTGGEHANHYTTDVVFILHVTVIILFLKKAGGLAL